MKVIAVVGSIGSGKSWVRNQIPEVCDYKLHIHRVDLDQVSKELFRTNESLRNELVHSFGPIMVDQNMGVKKKFVIDQIMSNDVLYTRLNNILFGYIKEWLETSLPRWYKDGVDLVVIEGAILIHAPELWSYFDSIIHVNVSKEVCKERVQERNLYTDRQFEILYKRSTPTTSIGLVNQPIHYITTNIKYYSNRQIKHILDIEFGQVKSTTVLYSIKPEIHFEHIIEDRLSCLVGAVNNVSNREVAKRIVQDTFKQMGIQYDTISIIVNDATGALNVQVHNGHLKSPGVIELEEHWPRRKEKVVIYAGSFYPLHNGHLDVIHELLDIFDRVILLRCINGSKEGQQLDEFPIKQERLPKGCDFQVWAGAFIDYIDGCNKLDMDITVARGIRNGSDLDYENAYIQHNRDMMIQKYDTRFPPVVYVPCREKFKHISSSSIRAILPFDEAYAKSLIV